MSTDCTSCQGLHGSAEQADLITLMNHDEAEEKLNSRLYFLPTGHLLLSRLQFHKLSVPLCQAATDNLPSS